MVNREETNVGRIVYFSKKKKLEMVSSNDVIRLIKSFPLTERLRIVEEIVRTIREEGFAQKAAVRPEEEEPSGPPILRFAGIMDEEEASVWRSAVEESRKIDQDEW